MNKQMLADIIPENVVKNILIILSFLFSLNLYSQKINEEYYLFSDEHNSENLILKNDSILIIKPIFRGGIYIKSHYEEQKYKYEIIKDTLIIYNFKNAKNVKYKIAENYIENSVRKEIYVIRNAFDTNPDLAVKYNDKIHWIDSPQTSNGVIIKEGKVNRKIRKLFKGKNCDDLSLKLYSGYDAFKLFGYQYVFGIIEVRDKK